jgi:hypothetical protein
MDFQSERTLTDLVILLAHAVVTCPLGPTVKTFVGRVDRSTANPEGLLPNPRDNADNLVRLFQEKGISPGELAALLGAHSTSRQFEFDPPRTGAAFDSTPGIWDVVSFSPNCLCFGP